VFATSEEHKRAALKRIIQKIIDKDLSFWFSREEYIKFTRFLDRITTLNGQRIKLIPLARELGYTKHLVTKYIHFLSENGLIILLSPRSHDKTRELSKSTILYRRDTGILHYLQDALNKKIIGNLTLKTAIIGELVKQQHSDLDQLKYYQKTNGSMIDVIVDYQSHHYAIQITDSMTASYPKIFQHSPDGLSHIPQIKLAHVSIPSHSDTHITLPHELVSLLFAESSNNG
jgi:predicted AAA+ superfamily ATPase